MQLANSTVLITGGASGLGRACVEHILAQQAKVVVADLNETAGKEIAETNPQQCRFIRTDVTSEDSVKASLQFAVDSFGTVRGLVHCAGILSAARVLGKRGPHDLELFRRMIDVNLSGTFNVLRLAAAAMSENDLGPDNERGVLLATSSIAATEGQIGQAAYAAAKAGVSGLVLPMARELAAQAIRVVAIAPGVFETELMASTPPEIVQSLTGQVPFPPRLGRPQEFAALAAHVLTNPYLNGTTIRLDGGLRMSAR